MRALWRVMERAVPDRRWFVTRFTHAAETVVANWAPRWARAPLLGRPIGVWALLALWLGLPLALVLL